jgi:hypothetical protein
MKSVFFVAALQMAACLAAPEPHPAAAVAAPAVEVPEDATAAPVVEKKVETALSKGEPLYYFPSRVSFFIFLTRRCL